MTVSVQVLFGRPPFLSVIMSFISDSEGGGNGFVA